MTHTHLVVCNKQSVLFHNVLVASAPYIATFLLLWPLEPLVPWKITANLNVHDTHTMVLKCTCIICIMHTHAGWALIRILRRYSQWPHVCFSERSRACVLSLGALHNLVVHGSKSRLANLVANCDSAIWTLQSMMTSRFDKMTSRFDKMTSRFDKIA